MKKEQRRREAVNPNTMIITVDISKNSHHVYFRSGSGFESRVFEIKNSYEGFQLFLNQMYKFKKMYHLTNLIFGYESTGPYAEPLVNFLSNQEMKFVQVNPRHVKRTKDISDNSPLKSDKKDPKIIADLIQLGHYLNVINPKNEIANLRRLSGNRERLISFRTKLYNTLYSQVYLIFPELSDICDLKTKTGQWLLKEYQKPEIIAQLSFANLKESLTRVSRGRFKVPKIEAIFNTSKTSIGIKEGSDMICFEISLLLKQIEDLNISISATETKMREELAKVDYAQELLSMPGIAEVSAATLIGEVGGFRNYKYASQVEKLAGYNLFENSSGQRRSKHFISKRGRSILRKTYYYIALNSIRKGKIFHQDYMKYRKKEKPHHKAIVAIARKLIRLTFALVRDKTRFDKDYFYSNKKERRVATENKLRDYRFAN